MNRMNYILALLLTLPALMLGAQEDSLAHYLSEAARNNPSVRAAYLAYEAAQQKLPQAGAYADPTLEIGAFLEPMEYASGRQIAQFQVMQMFPWFGTRKAARTEARHMANMAFEQFREARDNVFMEVYAQWYVLCSIKQKIANSDTNLQWVKQLEKLALQKYTSGTQTTSPMPPPTSPQPPPKEGGMNGGGMTMGGKVSPSLGGGRGEVGGMAEATGGMAESMSGLSDVLRIQLEIMELESNRESLQAELRAGKAAFNTLLNRQPEGELSLPDEWEQLPYRPDTESLLREIAERNPMLGMFREEALAYEAKAEMDKKMGYPMFGIGLQYMLMSPLPTDKSQQEGAMNGMADMESEGPMMNGKDMLMPMLSVTIPLYRNKYKAARKESQLLRQASESRQADAFNRLQAELYQAVYQLEEAGRKAALYRRQAALASTTGELARQEFVSGKSDLSSLIQVERQLLDYRLKESEAIAAYNTMVARIRKMISFLTIE